jgi:gamma-glutamyltranspeptidase
MSPVLVTDSNGNVIFIAGGSGGSRIISSVAQVALYNLWLGKSIRDAVDMPRLHQQLIPMEVELEKRFPVVCYQTFLDPYFHSLNLECCSWSSSKRSYNIWFSWWMCCSSNRTSSC